MKKGFILSTIFIIFLGFNLSSFGMHGTPDGSPDPKRENQTNIQIEPGKMVRWQEDLKNKAHSYYLVNVKGVEQSDSLAKLKKDLRDVNGHQLFVLREDPFPIVVAIPSYQRDNFLSNVNQYCQTREISSLMTFKLVTGKDNPDSKDDPCYMVVYKAEPMISKIFDVNSDFEFNDGYSLLDDNFISRTIVENSDSTPEEKSKVDCFFNGEKYTFYWLLDYLVPEAQYSGEKFKDLYAPFTNVSIEIGDESSRQFAGGVFKFETPKLKNIK